MPASATNATSASRWIRLRRRFAWLATATAAGILLLLSWAMLWPEESCAQPACARQRFTLGVEVDAFRGVTPIQFEVLADRRRASPQSVLREGGIDVRVNVDQLDLPYRQTSGALDRADLYQFASAWRGEAPSDADGTVYALFAPALVSDTGEPLFGLMFDMAGREGLAVAPATIERYFGELDPPVVQTLQLRTFVHELLHALNRHHADAVQMSDGRLTLEAPTRCIAEQQRSHWALHEAPLLAISPDTIRFFQTADSRDILPGRQNSPFQLRRASPTECDDVRTRTPADPALTRWELAIRRLQRLFSIQVATAQQRSNEEGEPPSAAVYLKVYAQPGAYPLGYPIALRILVRNKGSTPLPLKDRLNPSYGLTWIEYRRAGESDWQILQPLAWFEPVADEQAMLEPGEQTEQTVPIFFGDQGWTFAQPGEYEVRTRLKTGPDASETLSSEVTIRIVAPDTPDDRTALEPLLNADGQLDQGIGRLLTFGGRIGSEADIAPLETSVQRYSHTALGSALRLTLLSQRLRPAIDPLTGERPMPDFSDARDLLADTCTDSGVAALKYQLLQRHAGELPEDRTQTSAAAWDGTTTRNRTIATYSDPALQPWGPTLHFCFDEADLRGKASAAIPRLVRQLQRQKPARVIVVGHGDYEGACRYNDQLALRRAGTVRHALRAAGLRRTKIEIASLGERRPLDFAASDAAHNLNRRVELLVEGAAPDGSSTTDAVLPRCPAR